jgi:ribosomal protein S18 acetylase RimI-like enzyme
MSPRVRSASSAADLAWIAEAAREVLGHTYQVHSQRQFDVRDGNLLLAEVDGEAVGFLSWLADDDGAEVLAIACSSRRRGAGRALMRAAATAAAAVGAQRVWLVTTDANTGAQAFYQRLGYTLVERRVGAVDECRTRYKATIPTHMHDELVYELVLYSTPSDRALE